MRKSAIRSDAGNIRASTGPLNVVGGIENSCNYFFSEVAHRLSTETDGSYKPEKGLETLKNTRPCSVWIPDFGH